MGWGKFLSFIFILFSISLLVFYWFIPFNSVEFGIKSKDSNFNIGNSSTKDMQFYDNMRYPSKEISYKIYECPLQKKENMNEAFEIVSNISILEFYSVDSKEDISVTCDSKNKIKEGLFIAGEGGPTNITKTDKFNVISHGSILLIKKSLCSKPNVAIHEVFHTLGFDHSKNPRNIMYNVSRCNQVIGNDTINLINELYSSPSYSDLDFENVSAKMNGRYLDIDMSIRNNGLKESEDTKIIVYVDKKQIKEINLESMEVGFGRVITFTNIWVSKINVEKIEFLINSSFNELEKENNRVILEIKK
ncbi:hypothetical protein CMI40_00580 [Candidatus Pacearchaeota archaeon]|jgi:hypothetical protein|nr:hypothetical protein [Candidatus Pacearchaeota archaeon]|tara:strand:- start:1263 stop:2174 length:912 start_codon:yes stop_codon:yes gene_type:complete